MFSFACQKRTRKAPATFEAREARIKGCSPLIIPKQLGSIQKIQVAALKDFLCCADFESLARRTVRVSLCIICRANAPAWSQRRQNAVCRYDPPCEKVTPKRPQSFRSYKIQNMISADDAQSKAARILNRHAVVRLPAVPCPQTSAPQ